MKNNFSDALAQAEAHKELPFPKSEYDGRLHRARKEMSKAGIELLFLMSPESIYYFTGFQSEWYQAQSGKAFPPTSGIAIHADHDYLIHFETPSEAILTAISSISPDVRIFPMEHRRDGLGFILAELSNQGWLTGSVGLELYNYRPNPVITKRITDGFNQKGGLRGGRNGNDPTS